MHNQNNESNSFDTIKDQVIDLLHSNKQEFIYLTGAAGTGKTTLLEAVKAELEKENDSCSPNRHSCT
ncbi:MAG: AAA family ATPase [Gammaproteobacteria bacterium]